MVTETKSEHELTSLQDENVDKHQTELVRLMIQSLGDMGYSRSAQLLEKESGTTLESSNVIEFKNSIHAGNWGQVESLLPTLSIQTQDLKNVLFLIRQAKFLELLDQGEIKSALIVLRQELAPLHIHSDKLHELSGMLMNSKDLKSKSDGQLGTCRKSLLSNLQYYIPPHIMIPEQRLETLLQQAIQLQKTKCMYHNTQEQEPVSLYTDHVCDKNQFPLTCISILEEHGDEVWFLSFSHNGEYLASASKDSTAIIWSALDWKPVTVLNGHTDAISFLAWSPDDTKLLTASNDHSLKCWNVSTGVCEITFTRHTEAVTSCAWLPDGTGFVSGSLEKVIYLWNLSGEIVHKWSGIRVMDLAITSDGKTLIASSDKKIRLYDLETKSEVISLLETESITSVFIGLDDRYILVNLSIQEIHLWDIQEKRLIRKFIGQKQGRFVIRSCFGGNVENFVLSGSEDCQVYVWNREQGVLIEVLSGHTGCVNCVSFNSKHNVFASASDDMTIRIWGSTV